MPELLMTYLLCPDQDKLPESRREVLMALDQQAFQQASGAGATCAAGSRRMYSEQVVEKRGVVTRSYGVNLYEHAHEAMQGIALAEFHGAGVNVYGICRPGNPALAQHNAQGFCATGAGINKDGEGFLILEHRIPEIEY